MINLICTSCVRKGEVGAAHAAAQMHTIYNAAAKMLIRSDSVAVSRLNNCLKFGDNSSAHVEWAGVKECSERARGTDTVRSAHFGTVHFLSGSSNRRAVKVKPRGEN